MFWAIRSAGTCTEEEKAPENGKCASSVRGGSHTSDGKNHADVAYEVLLKVIRRKGTGTAHPDHWERDGLKHGMSREAFSAAKSELERSRRVEYSMATRYEDSFYYVTGSHNC
jgi:hypothetical protein